MAYKERVITGKGYSRLGTEADGDYTMQSDLEAGDKISGGGVTIPYHAVDRLIMTKTMVDRADRNPYGCEAGSGGGKVCSARTCVSKTCN